MSIQQRLSLKNIPRIIALALYYLLCRWLPNSSFPIFGKISKKLRYFCCKIIFKKCGRDVNVERGACFGCGFEVEIGDRSGIGINCHMPSDTIIGSNVNMGPEVYILARNHAFDRTDIIMQNQGYYPPRQTVIGDDVWIGRQVLMTPGRTISRGTIIGAGCVLTKDFPEYSIVGGNPSRLIRSRLNNN